MRKKINLETKVGLFFVACFIIVAYISLKLGNYEFGETGGYTISALFPSAAGVNEETPVLMAGLRIGMVSGMKLEGGQARILMQIKSGTQIPDDSSISIQSRGFLGARYFEISPGKSRKSLRDGDIFSNVSVAGELGALSAQAGDIAEDLKAITANLRKVLGGEEGEEGVREIFNALQEISSRLAQTLEDNQARMNAIAENIQTMTQNVAAMSQENRVAIREAIAAMPAIATNLQIISQNLAQFTNDNNREINDALKGLAESTESLKGALANINSITRKVDEGQGTLGKLINDTETIDELGETLDSINDFVGKIRRFQTYVGYRGEWWLNESDLKSYLSLRLQPREDKWYSISLIDDPFGRLSKTTTYTTTTTDLGGPNEHTDKEKQVKREYTDTFKFSAQIAKRWHFLVFRGGLLESTGGVGTDVLLFDDHLSLSLEAFDFGGSDNPRLKAYMDFMFLDHFFITAGADDFIAKAVLNGDDNPHWLVGGGIFFNDEDITALFTRVPMPNF